MLEREGRKHSDILADQMASSGGSLLGGGLRYPRDQLTVLWVRCKQTTLDERCDKRVEQMLSDGLLAELQAFHQVCLHPFFDVYEIGNHFYAGFQSKTW